MKYKNMSEEMKDFEISQVFQMIFPYGKLSGYKRKCGYITVYYSLPNNCENRERKMDFLPDDIYIVGESRDEPPDGVLLNMVRNCTDMRNT